MLTLAAIPAWIVGLLVALFVVLSVMMMLVVLIQRPQGGGLSEAFGSGSGSGNTAFGAKTGDALTTATIGIFVLFIGFAIGLNYIVKPPEAPASEPAVTGTDGSAPVGAPGAPATAPTPGQPGTTDMPVSVTTTDPTTGEKSELKLERVENPGFSVPPTSATTPPAGATPPPANPPASGAPATAPAAPPATPPATPPAEQPRPQ